MKNNNRALPRAFPGELPIQTTFKDLPKSDVVDGIIREEAAKLERFFHHITSVRIVVEKPNRHHRTGAPYNVRIELDVPGNEIVVNSSPNDYTTLERNETASVHKSDEFDTAHKDVQLAVRDAFHKAGRRLQEYATRIAERRSD